MKRRVRRVGVEGAGVDPAGSLGGGAQIKGKKGETFIVQSTVARAQC